ncbi:MAG: hypothetical protein HQ518_12620 [Rhodopirellula sp.]|nr:hypothetical protein [Rhodopirellula sp.]
MTIARIFGCRMLTAGLVLAAFSPVAEAGNPAIPAQKPLENLTAVPLFEAIAAGQVDVKLVHKDEAVGNIFIENNSALPINVQMPEAFVGVHVLNQSFFGPNNGNSPFGNQSGQNSSQGQGGQTTGGGASNTSSSSGPDFFSVPPGKIVRIPVKTVCLEHGRPTPCSRMEYRIFPVERFSQDPALFVLLATVAKGKAPQKVVQAAVWHIASEKSWKQLAAMRFRRLGSLPDIPEFTQSELSAARKLTEQSQQIVDQKRQSSDDLSVSESVVARREVQAR